MISYLHCSHTNIYVFTISDIITISTKQTEEKTTALPLQKTCEKTLLLLQTDLDCVLVHNNIIIPNSTRVDTLRNVKYRLIANLKNTWKKIVW